MWERVMTHLRDESYIIRGHIVYPWYIYVTFGPIIIFVMIIGPLAAIGFWWLGFLIFFGIIAIIIILWLIISIFHTAEKRKYGFLVLSRKPRKYGK